MASIPRLNFNDLSFLYQSYYQLGEGVESRDPKESETISPRAMGKNSSVEYVRDYTSLCGQYTIKRFTNPDEQTAFNQACDHLKDKSSFAEILPSLGGSIVSDNVVLVDINAPDGFHTICLWKTDPDTIRVLDPTNISMTCEKIWNLAQTAGAKNIQFETFGKCDPSNIKATMEKDIRFYGPKKGAINHPIGIEDGMRRDCIDIAVKIAFAIVEGQKDIAGNSTVEALVLGYVMPISNQKSINGVLQKASDGTCMRGLQNSDLGSIRGPFLDFFKQTQEIHDFVAVHKLEDLEKIEHLKEKESNERVVALKRFGMVSADQVLSLNSLVDRCEQLTNEISMDFPFLEAAVSRKKEVPNDMFIVDQSKGWTTLHKAAMGNGSVEEVLKCYDLHFKSLLAQELNRKPRGDLVKQMESLIGRPDVYGQTALHWAVDKKNINGTQELLRFMSIGDICRQRDGSKQTALHFAAQSDNLNLVTLLIEKDKDHRLVGIVDQWGQTALHWAASSGFIGVCDALSNAMTPEQLCIQMGMGGDRRQTALHFAAQGGHKEIVEMLAQKGGLALVNTKDKWGQLPILWAYAQNRRDIIDILS